MFIERSAGRVRLARAAFVLLGVLPCAALCGWAAVRHSDAHRASLERRCEQVVGLPVSIGSVEHVRPHAMRLRDCRLSAASGLPLFRVPVIEVETLPGEIRLTLPRLACTPESARLAARLADDWLRQPVRFPANCVVDVGDFSWRLRSGPDVVAARPARVDGDHPERSGGPGRPLHVECVAANGSRAVRLRLTGGAAADADELRVVLGPDASGAGPGRVESDSRMEVVASIAEPLPVAVLEAVCGLEPGAVPLGEDAIVSGAASAVFAAEGASGSGSLQIERVDLSSVSRHLPHRMAGEAVLAVDRLTWSRGRIDGGACHITVSRGRIGQRFLDACVSLLGCRPGPAYRTLAGDEIRPFDDVGFTARFGPEGLLVRASPGRSGGLARVQGLAMLEEPAASVSLDRLAWLAAAPGAAAVPASRATAWLLDSFSIDPPAAAATPGETPRLTPPEQAGRPRKRSEF